MSESSEGDSARELEYRDESGKPCPHGCPVPPYLSYPTSEDECVRCREVVPLADIYVEVVRYECEHGHSTDNLVRRYCRRCRDLKEEMIERGRRGEPPKLF